MLENIFAIFLNIGLIIMIMFACVFLSFVAYIIISDEIMINSKEYIECVAQDGNYSRDCENEYKLKRI